MAEELIDITPGTINPGISKGKRLFIFQETEWAQIRDNPAGLTREGVEKKIELWKNSNNKQTVAKYQTMLAQCKALTSSGKTKDGKIILSRNKDGSANWVSN